MPCYDHVRKQKKKQKTKQKNVQQCETWKDEWNDRKLKWKKREGEQKQPRLWML